EPPIKQKENDIIWYDTGIEELLKKYNVDVQKKMLMMYELHPGRTEVAPRAYGDIMDKAHPITKPLAGHFRITMFQASPLVTLTANPLAKVTELVKTRDRALATGKPLEFMEKKRPPSDAEPKSHAIAVAVEQERGGEKPDEKVKKATRIVVFGGSDW